MPIADQINYGTQLRVGAGDRASAEASAMMQIAAMLTANMMSGENALTREKLAGQNALEVAKLQGDNQLKAIEATGKQQMALQESAQTHASKEAAEERAFRRMLMDRTYSYATTKEAVNRMQGIIDSAGNSPMSELDALGDPKNFRITQNIKASIDARDQANSLIVQLLNSEKMADLYKNSAVRQEKAEAGGMSTPPPMPGEQQQQGQSASQPQASVKGVPVDQLGMGLVKALKDAERQQKELTDVTKVSARNGEVLGFNLANDGDTRQSAPKNWLGGRTAFRFDQKYDTSNPDDLADMIVRRAKSGSTIAKYPELVKIGVYQSLNLPIPAELRNAVNDPKFADGVIPTMVDKELDGAFAYLSGKKHNLAEPLRMASAGLSQVMRTNQDLVLDHYTNTLKSFTTVPTGSNGPVNLDAMRQHIADYVSLDPEKFTQGFEQIWQKENPGVELPLGWKERAMSVIGSHASPEAAKAMLQKTFRDRAEVTGEVGTAQRAQLDDVNARLAKEIALQRGVYEMNRLRNARAGLSKQIAGLSDPSMAQNYSGISAELDAAIAERDEALRRTFGADYEGQIRGFATFFEDANKINREAEAEINRKLMEREKIRQTAVATQKQIARPQPTTQPATSQPARPAATQPPGPPSPTANVGEPPKISISGSSLDDINKMLGFGRPSEPGMFGGTMPVTTQPAGAP